MKEVPLFRLLACLTPYRLMNLGQVYTSLGLSRLSGRPISWGLPLVLTIEPTNRCNLACPQCSTGAGLLQRPYGDLSPALYQRILQQTQRSLLYLLLYDQGEPLLHAEYVEMVRLAKAAKVVVTCSSNGQLLADFAQARELVSSGLDQIILSVDGLEESTYQIYRRGGRLENVVAAIAHLRRAREQLKQKTPRICLQFLVMKHNEHEVERVHDTARRWGADRVLIKSVQVRSPQDADRFLPLAEKYRRYTLGSGRLTVKSKKSKICDRLWTGCVIHQNGHVVGCCFDKDESALLGRLTEQPFLTIWRGEALRHFRRRVAGSCKPDICNNCTHGLDLYQ
ncbi:MAG: pyrroloquinoline quinone biosynthesis protein PqqE [bacterium ADurb.Bin478]|nr:MAG: pyrroloquinoline quinone biosynthesis protein PqqE [bacterium ADurb.Bin478]